MALSLPLLVGFAVLVFVLFVVGLAWSSSRDISSRESGPARAEGPPPAGSRGVVAQFLDGFAAGRSQPFTLTGARLGRPFSARPAGRLCGDGPRAAPCQRHHEKEKHKDRKAHQQRHGQRHRVVLQGQDGIKRARAGAPSLPISLSGRQYRS